MCSATSGRTSRQARRRSPKCESMWRNHATIDKRAACQMCFGIRAQRRGKRVQASFVSAERPNSAWHPSMCSCSCAIWRLALQAHTCLVIAVCRIWVANAISTATAAHKDACMFLLFSDDLCVRVVTANASAAHVCDCVWQFRSLYGLLELGTHEGDSEGRDSPGNAPCTFGCTFEELHLCSCVSCCGLPPWDCATRLPVTLLVRASGQERARQCRQILMAWAVMSTCFP